MASYFGGHHVIFRLSIPFYFLLFRVYHVLTKIVKFHSSKRSPVKEGGHDEDILDDDEDILDDDEALIDTV